MKMKMPTLRAAVLAALVPAFVAGCTTSTAANPPAAAPVAQTQQMVRGPGFDFSQLAEQEGPAVVNISVTKEVAAQAPQMDENDPMYQFFKRFAVPMPSFSWRAPRRSLSRPAVQVATVASEASIHPWPTSEQAEAQIRGPLRRAA